MGEAYDRDGHVLGQAEGATKREVFEKLNKAHSDAEEIRIRTRRGVTALRMLDEHHDGHALNESIRIETDAPDSSGAAHYYEMSISGVVVASMQFQKGPRHEDGSTPGVTEAAMLVAMIDRLRGFQSGPYSCRENAIILTKLEECLLWTKARADARAKRGVLGKNLK